MAEWIVTDTTQFLKKDGERKFSVVDVLDWREEDGSIEILASEIDLNDYSEKEIGDYVRPFGYEFRNKTLFLQGTSDAPYGEDQDQIIAECIAETVPDEKTKCANEEELRKELNHLGISHEIKAYEFGIYFENE